MIHLVPVPQILVYGTYPCIVQLHNYSFFLILQYLAIIIILYSSIIMYVYHVPVTNFEIDSVHSFVFEVQPSNNIPI